MVLIETFPDESAESLSEAVRRAFATVGSEATPAFEFGWLIEWNQRFFREVRVTRDPDNQILLEELIFFSAMKDKSRATLQLGACQGVGDAVWVSPPRMGAEIAARIIDQGFQSTVRPFVYEHR